jgi:hypothetical protein
MLTRDPLSEWFDPAARRLIRRAYARRGEWVGVYLAPPSTLERAYAARLGVFDLYERDRWGEQRWVRAYKRAVYWNLTKHGFSDSFRPREERSSPWPGVSLEWETGKRIARANWPGRRWAIRVRLHDSGAAARAAVDRLPASERWADTPQRSTIDDREWET